MAYKIKRDGSTSVAVTGGIGSGKSYILECFKDLGFPVFNWDEAVHEILAGGLAYQEIARDFPGVMKEGVIDRERLGMEVFHDKEKLLRLESILHPKAAMMEKAFRALNEGRTVIVEVPLLFEKSLEAKYDIILCAIASVEIRKSRVMARKGMTEEKFSAIICNQVDDETRIAGSDIIIDTSDGKNETMRRVMAVANEE